MKQETELELELNILAKLDEEMTDNSIMSAFIRMVLCPMYLRKSCQLMRIYRDNLHTKPEEQPEAAPAASSRFLKPEEDKMSYINYDYFKICHPPILLDTLKRASATPVQEKKMFNDDFDITTSDTQDMRTRRSFVNDLRDAYDEKVIQSKDFHNLSEKPPESFNEFVDKVRNGQFTVKDHKKVYVDVKGCFCGYDFPYYVEWRDPSVKPNEDGHKAFMEKLDKEHTKAERKIRVLDLKYLPIIVEEFENIAIQ